MTEPNALRLSASDNVAVVLEEVPAGARIVLSGDAAAEGFEAREPIPFEHKVALAPIGEKEPVLKYGVPIGYATKAILRGEWVHTHNVDSYFAAKHREAMK